MTMTIKRKEDPRDVETIHMMMMITMKERIDAEEDVKENTLMTKKNMRAMVVDIIIEIIIIVTIKNIVIEDVTINTEIEIMMAIITTIIETEDIITGEIEEIMITQIEETIIIKIKEDQTDLIKRLMIWFKTSSISHPFHDEV